MKRIVLNGLLLALIGVYSTNLHSQATIGSGQAPAIGALLDLKEKADGTADKGLGMPRVVLTKLKPTTPAQLSASIGSTGNWNLTEHIGLTIYNIKEAVFNPVTCKTEGAGPVGLYVWNGSKWQGIATKGNGIGIADPLETETATTLTDREGNTYPISTFGAAGTWMTQNLRTTTAPGLAAMTESVTTSASNMYYAYPKASGAYLPGQPASWTPQQGLLYNWAATMNKNTCATTNQAHGEPAEQTEVIQGICPFGWHVPSDREWNELEEVFSASTTEYTNTAATTFAWSYNQTTNYRPNNANVFGHGKSMKSTTTINGIASNGDSKPATAGGFNFLLLGYADNGSMYSYGSLGYQWSSSANGASTWLRSVSSIIAGVNRIARNRSLLFSVRCKKD